MSTNYSLTVSQVAAHLGFTKSYIQRLIRQGRLKAKLQNAPVKYYLIDPISVEQFNNSPKNKGGRPKKVQNLEIN
jgi:hypothetical protein